MEWVEGVDFVYFARQHKCDNLVFTANNVIKHNKLVMGKGAALRVRDEFAYSASLLAKVIGSSKDYLLATVTDEMWEPETIHALQVKRHYADNADWNLCEKSLSKLRIYCTARPLETFVMNCPMIGAGGFGDSPSKVFDLIEEKMLGINMFVTRY